MAEKWEREYPEIIADSRVFVRPGMTWRQLLPIMDEKWDLSTIATEKKASFKAHEEAKREADGELPYMLKHENCAFCQKASEGLRRPDYGHGGLSCAACVLRGKCYDQSWIVKRIYLAMLAEDWPAFNALIAQGLADIEDIVAAKEKEDEEEKELPK